MDIIEGKYFKMTRCTENISNRRKIIVQDGYLPITFVSRTVLTIAVSHPLLTLEVYGTARIRVLCGKEKIHYSYTTHILAIYNPIKCA